MQSADAPMDLDPGSRLWWWRWRPAIQDMPADYVERLNIPLSPLEAPAAQPAAHGPARWPGMPLNVNIFAALDAPYWYENLNSDSRRLCLRCAGPSNLIWVYSAPYLGVDTPVVCDACFLCASDAWSQISRALVGNYAAADM